MKFVIILALAAVAAAEHGIAPRVPVVPPVAPIGGPGYRAPIVPPVVPVGGPGYRAPIPVGGPGYRAPIPVGGPGYRAPIPVGGPGYRAPIPVGGPGYHAPIPVGGPGYHAPIPVGGPGYRAPYHDEPAPYQYGYSVNDEYTGTRFSAEESRDGYATNGVYSVDLPDGRTQTVTYTVADDYSGYVADVQYTGEAHYEPYRAPVAGPAYRAPVPAYHA